MLSRMPRFQEDSHYPNVNELAKAQGLIWDGQYGSPYDLEKLIEPALWDAAVADQYDHLFDHTIRFRPLGRGARRPVMAVSAPYQRDDEELRESVLSFCVRFDLAARVGDERYRLYSVPATLTIVFWRPDRHLLR